jgi:hypothetical protein
MKEIKFRTWNPKFHYFEYWGFILDEDGNKYFKGTPSGGGFVSNQILENTDQYINVKDINGKEIYENDLMSHPDFPKRYRLTVMFENGCAYLGGWDCIRTDFSKGEIIGNIKENKELPNG